MKFRRDDGKTEKRKSDFSMGAKWKAAFAMILFSVAVCAGFGVWKYQSIDKKEERVWHHELAAAADPTLGSDTVPADFMVDENFTSHLPLVIIDTGGEEIVNYKYYDPEVEAFRYQDGIDPYIRMQISFINNESMVNRLGDEPTGASYGKIKVRGNTSSSPKFPKKQYLMKLQTQDEEPYVMEVFGMTASDTWILNGTELDRSYLRNYIAMNTAGELSPYTPDMRFCEMVLKRGEKYEYMGLYGMYEKIEQGEGRVEIEKDTGYLLLRDRIDTEGLSMPVWSTKHQKKSNWVNLEYPSSDKISEEYWNYIRNDVNQIEDSLYSEDRRGFKEYEKKLNVDSFVDYFIINEFFTNYDAGWNSTFMYKDRSGQLFIGPYWDFDGAVDNFTIEMLDIREMALPDAPWFDRLLTDEDFTNKVIGQYGKLRKNLLNEKELFKKIDKAAIFIEKPVKRDLSRWSALYSNPMQLNIEKNTGIAVDRATSTWEEEVQRLKDIIRLHGSFLDSDMTQLYRFVENGREEVPNTMLGIYFIIAFFVSIILVQRTREGLR